jgi:hypothetical protein
VVVVDAAVCQRSGERVSAVLRVPARAREPADVDQQLDVRRRQQLDQLVDRAGGMADGEESGREG